MAYCEPADLELGDLMVGSRADLPKLVKSAAEEIDAYLGELYVLPLPSALPLNQQLFLKRMNVLIASGRFWLGQGEQGNDASYSQYGMSLLKEGQSLLMQFRNGQLELNAPKVATRGDGSGPMIQQADETSPVDAFYDMTMRGLDTYWHPGYR